MAVALTKWISEASDASMPRMEKDAYTLVVRRNRKSEKNMFQEPKEVSAEKKRYGEEECAVEHEEFRNSR